eukprot:CAMPEP_0202713642 /NCGR_PEP_ID=MMETSP1385-20130828/57201_1 /ASSEMBLY_ACC=CAM_ASM_000861 /TAXON_ID=933848 /ORGANISM="Elphidium margaritaceum" /LENGTH=420 /DNA_ID=CAMNT_0049374059 /DNA_START=40 /DNA_END=1302 /DNA_ORIENTATION=-
MTPYSFEFGELLNAMIVQQTPAVIPCAPQPPPEQQQTPSRSVQMKHNVKIQILDTVEEEKEFEAMSPSPSLSSCSSSSSSASASASFNLMHLNLNALAPEFIPGTCTGTQLSRPIQHRFVPKHAARAKCNIYIPKHMTKTLLTNIVEYFPNTNALYYYLDITTAFQINDEQLKVTQLPNGTQLVLVHYDLRCKHTQQWLYAAVTPNDAHKIEVDTEKWLWKVDEFLTAPQILSKYALDAEYLPKSSRAMKTHGLYHQLKTQMAVLGGINDMRLLTEQKWSENCVTQVASSQKCKKHKKTTTQMEVTMTTLQWLQSCVNSWHHIPAIPIVVYENREQNAHWIEWVKMVYVESAQRWLGVGFRYINEQRKWQITSVCLDKNDIHNKHRLISLQSSGEMSSLHSTYDAYFDQFETGSTSVRWY